VAGELSSSGISSGVHYPLTLAEQPALPELHEADVPVAGDWARRELSLPLFPELREAERDAVVEEVNVAVS
jgi:dTDP-4-amino-4,6-dideoxygalactose transaminase